MGSSTTLAGIIKDKNISRMVKIRLVQSMVSVVMTCGRKTEKKAEKRRREAFELWTW